MIMEVSEVSEVQRPSENWDSNIALPPPKHHRNPSHGAHGAHGRGYAATATAPVNATWSLGMCWMTFTLTRFGFAHLFLGQCCRQKGKIQNVRWQLQHWRKNWSTLNRQGRLTVWQSLTLRSVLFLNPCGMWWIASTPLRRFVAWWLVVNWEK